MTEEKTPFKLSDPGTSLANDPTMGEYLRCYDFPQPPDVRYGCLRFNSLQQQDRVSLFGQAWLPSHAMGTILLLHGFSEHTGNFSELVRFFVKNKFAVIAMDMRGHGLSEGPRGHLENPHFYAEDIETFIRLVFHQVLPHRPLYLWGHSLGSLVGLQVLLRGKLPIRPSAAVFSSAFLGFPELTGVQKFLATFASPMAKLLPTLPISHGISPQKLSHDESYLARRNDDPLISKVATPKWFTSCEQAISEVQRNAETFQHLTPTLFLLAGNENITNLNEARRFAFTAYNSTKHKVIEFPGFFHELEKEPEIRERVVQESVAWFKSHSH